MIDEKFFEALKRESFDWKRPVQIDPEFGRELIRLARLGLWAEKKGIPTIKSASECGAETCSTCTGMFFAATSALPKEGS